MPAKVKVKVVSGRNLPVMDRGSDTTDAYVELRLGSTVHKTDVCRKSLNPQWACAEWFRFEVDDAELQDEPLQLRLMDHDTYSANDAIGKVYISLNPLLLQRPHPDTTHSAKGAVMSGWIPVFDTMHGIRGEIKVIVKVELFNDFNKFRQSSCGVQFFHSPVIPQGFQVQTIHGFVEELVVNDDPEYQWIDKIRTPRASNEARQVAFLKLSGQVQRKIGLKALELGANAVIGFRRCLDLEGEVGVVARGSGTAVTLVRLLEQQPSVVASAPNNVTSLPEAVQQSCAGATASSPGHARADSHGTTANVNINITHRRSSDSDITGATPKDANNLSSSKGRNEKFLMPVGRVEKFSVQGGSLTTAGGVLRPSMNQDNIDLLEYPFLTIVKFPQGFITHVGGSVTARSVKLLERVPNPEEPAPRDAWWSELRTEVRSHMRSLRCNAVLAYQETTTISDDVCVLSATGTAAVIDLRLTGAIPHSQLGVIADTNSGVMKNNELDTGNHTELTQTTSLDRTDFEKSENMSTSNIGKNPTDSQIPGRKRISECCGPCHLPYNSNSVPFQVHYTKCHICKKGRVPSVLLCTIEPLEGLSIVGRGCLVQAVASKVRTPGRGEPAARDISDQLPFLEYELHRLLLAKLRIRGMNAIFGLKTTITIGANIVAAVGIGTGVLLEALGPCAGGPRLRAAPGDPRLVKALQRGLDDALHANKDVYHLHMESDPPVKVPQTSETDESEEELPDLELGAGNKDTCILEVDDAEDLEVLKMLTEARPPGGLHVVNTQSVPGLPGSETLGSVAQLQMFTQLWRARLNSQNTSLHPHFHRLLQTVYFKLRRMVPCAVCDLKFRLDLPEADEIQLVVTGMAFRINEAVTEKAQTMTQSKADKETTEDDVKKLESNEMIFTLDEESAVDINCPTKTIKNVINKESLGYTASPFQSTTNGWRPTVVMTPLALIPGGRIFEYLGNLDFIFVRESTSVREQGGLSGFLHTFITEVLAIVRAHVTALSGNAIVAFYMTELILSDTPHKNQAQCLVSVGGDVVSVSYFENE